MSSETLLNFHRITRRYTPEYRTLYSACSINMQYGVTGRIFSLCILLEYANLQDQEGYERLITERVVIVIAL
jgi:hypothetical protein